MNSRDSAGSADVVDAAFARMRRMSKNPPRLDGPASKAPVMGTSELDDATVPGLHLDRSPQLHQQQSHMEDSANVESIRALERIIAAQKLGQAYGSGGAAGRATREVVGRPTGLDGRKARRGLGIPTLGTAIGKEVRRRGWQHELANGWIMGNWSALVGEKIAQHTQPEKIDGTVVFVRCDSSNWATQVRYIQRPILAKIAEKVGPDVVTELKILGPAQHRNYTGRMWVKTQGSQDTYG